MEINVDEMFNTPEGKKETEKILEDMGLFDQEGPKKISSEYIMGNLIILKYGKCITKNQFNDFYNKCCEILDSKYNTPIDMTFSKFCEYYNYLVERVSDVVFPIAPKDTFINYFRAGLPMEVVKIFEEVAEKIIDTEEDIENYKKAYEYLKMEFEKQDEMRNHIIRSFQNSGITEKVYYEQETKDIKATAEFLKEKASQKKLVRKPCSKEIMDKAYETALGTIPFDNESVYTDDLSKKKYVGIILDFIDSMGGSSVKIRSKFYDNKSNFERWRETYKLPIEEVMIFDNTPQTTKYFGMFTDYTPVTEKEAIDEKESKRKYEEFHHSTFDNFELFGLDPAGLREQKTKPKQKKLVRERKPKKEDQ